ncbi:MAG: Gfo/Idh/MocA family oxidoreductase [Bryobacteraceae bacterium]|jgi:predicted dehydrogenase
MSADSSRRRFLEGATAAGSLLAAKTVLLEPAAVAHAPGPTPASDRVRFGMVGIGMQGSTLLRDSISLPGVECAGAADLWDGRHTLAREITDNPALPVSRRYQDLLARADIDCIVAAVPDHWHKRVVVDACNAGKDIYCEKPMTHAASEGFEMVEAARKNSRIVQIGSQRVSSALCAKARELYRNGAIGEVEMVELTLGRNSPTGAWVYPPPSDFTPQTMDWDTWLNDAPKIPIDAIRFARWRCWREYGTGVGGDLMVHLLSGMLFTLGWNEPPRSASALGGIFRWKDGRNMPDLHAVLFDYHGTPVYVRLGLGTDTPETSRFMGPKGVLEATGGELRFGPQSGLDTSPSYYSASFPAKMRADYVKQWHAEHDPQSGREMLPSETTYQGRDWDDIKPHLWNFFQAVKSRQPVMEDAVFGNNAAIACHMANESFFRQKAVSWDVATHSIK